MYIKVKMFVIIFIYNNKYLLIYHVSLQCSRYININNTTSNLLLNNINETIINNV